MRIAALDWGKDIIGLLDIDTNEYTYFYGENKLKAIEEIVKLDVLVTYNGENTDIPRIEEELGNSLKKSGFVGMHVDMFKICYFNGVGANLDNTYHKNLNAGHFPVYDEDKDDGNFIGSYINLGKDDRETGYEDEEHYINRNWSDCFQTLSLFVSWINNNIDSEAFHSGRLPSEFGLESLHKHCNWNVHCR